MDKNEIIIYQPDTTLRIDVRMEGETVWLTQGQIAELFGVQQPAISKHLKNIFKSGELDEHSVHSILEYTASDGKVYPTKFYNLDANVDESVLLLLGKRKKGVDAVIYTHNVTPQFQLDLQKYNEQYTPITIHPFQKSHDRFLILDDTDVYHIGASLKDLGKKWFAFSKMNIHAKEILEKMA